MALQVWLPLNGNLNNYGSNNNIVITGGITTTNTNGPWGSTSNCRHFPGTANGYIEVTNLHLSNTMSAAVWLKMPTSLTNLPIQFSHIFDARSGGRHEILCLQQGSFKAWDVVCSNTELLANTWYHIAVTNNNGVVNIYVNGELKTTGTNYAGGDYTSYCTIGARHSHEWMIEEDMADIRLYDDVLTAGEISMLYHLRKPYEGHTNKGLQAWLPLLGNLNNYGLNNTITCTNSGCSSTSTGKIGPSYTWNGTNNYMHINNVPLKSQISVSCWIKPKTNIPSNSFSHILDGRINDSGQEILCWQNDTVKAWNVVVDGSYFPIKSGVWYHIVATNNNSDVKIYVNGTLAATGVSNDSSEYISTIVVGARHTHVNFLQEQMNDIRIYNHILTLSEAKRLYQSRIGHYHCNGLAMSTGDKTEYDGAFGRKSKTAPANLSTSKKTAGSPRYQSCYTFNNNYIQLYKDYQVGPTDECTWMIWAYAASWPDAWNSGTYQGLIDGYEGGGIAIQSNRNSDPRGFYFIVSTIGTYGEPMSNVTAGWHLFTLTCDGITTKAYIDKTLVGSKTVSTNTKTALPNRSANVVIGGAATYDGVESSTGYKGKISEVSFYATALSAEDIAEIYDKAHIPA